MDAVAVVVTNPHAILYSYRRCPYAMRARMALFYAGITPEVREISFKDKPAHMLECSPKGTVPVLILDDGRVIDESFDIMRYALSQHDPDSWLNGDAAQTSSLIAQNDIAFKKALDTVKYSVRFAPEEVEAARDEAFSILSKHEQRLSEHNFLLGDHISLADIALFPFIRQFSMIKDLAFETLPYPHIQTWLADFTCSDLFTAIMQKQPTWHDGDAPVYLSV